MNIQELRIGNYIEWNNTKLIITCVNIDYCIGYDKLKDELIHDQCSKLIFKPIPLTEDILLKCGFYKGSEYYVLNGVNINIDNFDFTYFDNSLCSRKTKINSLHQLQNLYFALTGEELEVKF